MKIPSHSPESLVAAAGLVMCGILVLFSAFISSEGTAAPPVIYRLAQTQANETANQTEDNANQSEDIVTNHLSSDETPTAADNADLGYGEAQGIHPEEKQTININTADAASLCSLDGIGKVKAQNIIDYRNANGEFKTADEIMNVKGIGQRTYESIQDYICV